MSFRIGLSLEKMKENFEISQDSLGNLLFYKIFKYSSSKSQWTQDINGQNECDSIYWKIIERTIYEYSYWSHWGIPLEEVKMTLDIPFSIRVVVIGNKWIKCFDQVDGENFSDLPLLYFRRQSFFPDSMTYT